MSYRLGIEQSAFDAMLALSPALRRELLRFLDRVGTRPLVVGDFQLADSTGRPVEVKAVAGFTSPTGRMKR